MLRKILLFAIGISCISATMMASIYEALKITQAEAKKCLVASIGRSYLMNTTDASIVQEAKQLSEEEQVAGVKQLIQLAKEYTATEEFKKDYRKWRNDFLYPKSKKKFGLPNLDKVIDNAIDKELNGKEKEKNYPENGTELVKKRLADFIAVSATVDYDAVVTSGRFDKPEYERKSPEWKMCYRAGKAVVAAARAEAQKWLDELNSQK
jgi:hypothetical protein